MNRRTILTKTGKGLMEATGKTSDLSRDLRNLLKEIDGKVSVSALLERLDKFTEPGLLEALAGLERDGYLREFIGAQDAGGQAPLGRSPRSQPPSESGEDLDFTAFTPAKPGARDKEDARTQARSREIARQATRAREEAAARAKAEAAARAKAEVEKRARALAAEPRPTAPPAEHATAQVQALDQARREAEERQRRDSEEKARREAEARARIEAEERVKREAEERQRKEIQERSQRENEEKARRETEARARREAEERVRKEIEDRRRREIEEKLRHEEVERRLREEQERARRESEERARKVIEDRRRREIEEKLRQEEVERRLREEQERVGREAGEKERRKREEREHAERMARIDSEARAKVEAEERARREQEERQRRAEEEARRRKEAQEREARERMKEQEAVARREIEEKIREEEEREHREREERARRQEQEKSGAKEEASGREEEEILGEDEIEDTKDEAKRAKEEEKRAREEERARAKSEARAAEPVRPTQRARERAGEEAFRGDEYAVQERGKAARTTGDWARKKSGSPTRQIAVMLLILLIVAVAVIPFVPMESGPYEKAAQDWLGVPVKIGSTTVTLLPSPRLKFEKVVIGKDPQVRVAVVMGVPEIDSLTADKKVFRSLELSGVVFPSRYLPVLLSDKGKGNSLRVEHIVVKGLKLDIPELNLPPLDVNAKLGADGTVQSVVLSNAERKLSVILMPQGRRAAIEISADTFPLPIGGDLVLGAFSAKGTLAAGELVLNALEGRAFGGRLQGSARLRWTDGWNLDGELSVRQMEAAMLAAPLLAGGMLEGKGTYGMKASAPDKLFGNARFEGNFTIQKGSINNVDMTRVLQGSSTGGGTTLFSEMSGTVSADPNRLLVRQLRLAAGLLNGTGQAEMDAQKNLSGRLQIDLRAQTVQARATLAVAGTLKDPQFRRSD